MGSINGGSRVHYKEFIPFIAKMFNVDLKNHESLYGDIRRRKGREGENFSRLKYLRQMIDTLEKNMQTLDEKQHSRE